MTPLQWSSFLFYRAHMLRIILTAMPLTNYRTFSAYSYPNIDHQGWIRELFLQPLSLDGPRSQAGRAAQVPAPPPFVEISGPQSLLRSQPSSEPGHLLTAAFASTGRASALDRSWEPPLLWWVLGICPRDNHRDDCIALYPWYIMSSLNFH
jgi:hypothetical protein